MNLFKNKKANINENLRLQDNLKVELIKKGNLYKTESFETNGFSKNNNKKEIQEIETVSRFLKNQMIPFEKKDIKSDPEGKDSIIDCKYKNFDFQITIAPQSTAGIIGKLSKYKKVTNKETGGIHFTSKKTTLGIETEVQATFSEVKKSFIENPINHKRNKSDKKTILLINISNHSDSPIINLFKNDEKYFLDKQKDWKEIGFKEIYLVSMNNNFKLFPWTLNERH
jgi:hypothetical protein